MVAQYVSPRKGITGHEMIYASPMSTKRGGIMTKISRRQHLASIVAMRNEPTDLLDQVRAERALGKPAKRKRKRGTTNGSGNVDNGGFDNGGFDGGGFDNDGFNYGMDSGFSGPSDEFVND